MLCRGKEADIRIGNCRGDHVGRRDEIRFQVTPKRSYQQKNLKFSATTMGTRQHSITKITDRRKVTPQVSVALKSL